MEKIESSCSISRSLNLDEIEEVVSEPTIRKVLAGLRENRLASSKG